MLFRNLSGQMSITKTATACLVFIFFSLMGAYTAGTTETEEINNSGQPSTGKIPFPKPNSHRGNWIYYHGFTVGLDWNKTGFPKSTCLTCHEQSDCVTCHKTRKPVDHSNTWRTLGHGFMAEGNRDRCLSCHREDYCVRCHNETEPRSHRGNWETDHCSSCHYNGTFIPENECAVCHKKVDHSWAPHPINQLLDCSLCHKGS